MKKFFKIALPIILFLLLISPLATHAATQLGQYSTTSTSTSCSTSIQNVGDLLCRLGSIIKLIIPFLIALGVVYFVWGVVQYVINDTEEAKSKGKDKIIYGIIGFVIILGLWGLVSIVVNTFGIQNQSVDISGVTSIVDQNVANSNSNLCVLAPTGNPNLQQLINYITCIISKSVIPLIFALAIALFVWGVVQYVINDSDEEKKAKGKQFMIWGIVALTVMVGVWGLVGIVAKTFNIENTIPQLKSR